MKRVLIFGDSWSVVPRDMNHDGEIKRLGEWLDFHLMQRGHYVYNIGKNADDNRTQLIYAEKILQGLAYQNLHVDLVIWFHTETLRNLTNRGLVGGIHTNDYQYNANQLKTLGLDAYIDILAEQDYSHATKLKNQYPTTKWAIVGGHAPIRQNKKHMLDWADLLIENWRLDLTGIDCPDNQCYTLIRYNGFEDIVPLLDNKTIARELDYAEILNKACEDHDLFYDGVHPGVSANIVLRNILIEKFNL